MLLLKKPKLNINLTTWKLCLKRDISCTSKAEKDTTVSARVQNTNYFLFPATGRLIPSAAFTADLARALSTVTSSRHSPGENFGT